MHKSIFIQIPYVSAVFLFINLFYFRYILFLMFRREYFCFVEFFEIWWLFLKVRKSKIINYWELFRVRWDLNKLIYIIKKTESYEKIHNRTLILWKKIIWIYMLNWNLEYHILSGFTLTRQRVLHNSPTHQWLT